MAPRVCNAVCNGGWRAGAAAGTAWHGWHGRLGPDLRETGPRGGTGLLRIYPVLMGSDGSCSSPGSNPESTRVRMEACGVFGVRLTWRQGASPAEELHEQQWRLDGLALSWKPWTTRSWTCSRAGGECHIAFLVIRDRSQFHGAARPTQVRSMNAPKSATAPFDEAKWAASVRIPGARGMRQRRQHAARHALRWLAFGLAEISAYVGGIVLSIHVSLGVVILILPSAAEIASSRQFIGCFLFRRHGTA